MMHLLTAHKKIWHGVAVAGLVTCLLAFPPPAAAKERLYKVEAAFLYSFFNYITWPGYDSPQALQNPVICVYGNDPILSYLDYVRSKMSAERTITVRSVGNENEVAGCNILFIRHRIPPSISASSANVLTVFKADDPLDRGGIIELFEDEERITLKIDQAKLEQNGFQASSRLLELAQGVR